MGLAAIGHRDGEPAFCGRRRFENYRISVGRAGIHRCSSSALFWLFVHSVLSDYPLLSELVFFVFPDFQRRRTSEPFGLSSVAVNVQYTSEVTMVNSAFYAN